MKTLLKTQLASALVAILFSTNVFAADPGTTSIQKVIIKGNAKVFLIQSDKEHVEITNTNNSDQTTVQTKGTSLLITSMETEPVTIIVYVKALFRIEASNTSYVKTNGLFDLQYLQVILNDKATASVNASTKGLYTIVRDEARLKLSGISEEHVSIRSNVSKLKVDKLACLNTSTSYLKPVLANNKNKQLTAQNTIAKK